MGDLKPDSDAEGLNGSGSSDSQINLLQQSSDFQETGEKVVYEQQLSQLQEQLVATMIDNQALSECGPGPRFSKILNPKF